MTECQNCGRPIVDIETVPCRIEAGDCLDTVTERELASDRETVIDVRVIRHE